MLGNYGHIWGGGFWMIFLWVIVILGIVLLIWDILLRRSSNKSKKSEKALEILKKRYAADEIDRDEFHRKKEEIQSAVFLDDQ
jgi:putative membrane protein